MVGDIRRLGKWPWKSNLHFGYLKSALLFLSSHSFNWRHSSPHYPRIRDYD